MANGDEMVGKPHLAFRTTVTLVWLTLVVGLLSTISTSPGSHTTYILIHLLNGLALTAAVWIVPPARRENLAFWVMLAIFMFTNFIRFYWLALQPEAVQPMLPDSTFRKMMVNSSDIFVLYPILSSSMLMLLVGALAAHFALRKFNPSLVRKEADINHVVPNTASIFFAIAVVLMMLLGVISHYFAIGVMGAAAGEPLPFRLKGVIFYARTVGVPLLLIGALVLSDRPGHRVMTALIVLALMTHGVSDMILRGSRSGLLLSILLLAFWYLVSGKKMTRGAALSVAIAGAIAVSVVPFMTRFRAFRVGQGQAVIDALYSALPIGGNWSADAVNGIRFVFFRVTGMESLWAITTLQAKPLYGRAIEVLMGKDGMAGYLTLSVHSGMFEADNTLLAPGFLGWLYLIGGTAAIFAGSMVMGMLALLVWRYLDRVSIYMMSVVKVLMLWVIFLMLTEGTIEAQKALLLIGLATCAAMELYCRKSQAVALR
jgi:hypothetical protein